MSKQHLDDEMISRLHDWFEIPSKLELYKFISVWLSDVKADAWDEGQTSGWKNRDNENSYLIPSIENPYRGERE
jgi:hypothetical protein